MTSLCFEDDRAFLLNQFEKTPWLDETGLSPQALSAELEEIAQSGAPRMLIRARAFACILTKARLGMDARSGFAGTLDHQDWLPKLRERWRDEIDKGEMADCLDKHEAAVSAGAYKGDADFGHIAPDWEMLLRVGFPGMLERVRQARGTNGDREETPGFYVACEIVCAAILDYLRRVAAAARARGLADVADRFDALAGGAPRTLMEAYQLLDVMYLLLTHVEGESLRSMGRLDRLLCPFFEADIASGRYSRETLAHDTRLFLARMSAYRFCANVAMTLGGVEPDGSDSTNAFSYFLIDVYRTMKIYDPKMQIRVAKSTPTDFLEKVLTCCREGMNSFVFINDQAAVAALRRMGIGEEEARNYLLIGCYEPAVCGKEIPCSCNGIVNLAQAVEAAVFNGVDLLGGGRVGPATGDPGSFETFESFLEAVKAQYRFFAEGAMEMTNRYEGCYGLLNPAPLLSATMADCVRRGRDVYQGGAKYNNSSINSIGLATAVDSLCAIRQLVFEEKRLSLEALANALRKNWADSELLRRMCLTRAPKFGNADRRADELARRLTDWVAQCVNGRPNARGGVYRSGLFSIDWNIEYGAKTGATPDGRM